MFLLPDFVRPTNKIQVQSSSEQYIISNSPIISMIVAFLIRWWRGWQRGFAGLNHPNVPTFVAFCRQGTSTQYVDFSWQGFPMDCHRKAADPNSDKVFTFAGGGGRQATTSLLVLFNCSLNWLYLPWFHLIVFHLISLSFLFNLQSFGAWLRPSRGLALSRFSEWIGRRWFQTSKNITTTNHSFAVVYLW